LDIGSGQPKPSFGLRELPIAAYQPDTAQTRIVYSSSVAFRHHLGNLSEFPMILTEKSANNELLARGGGSQCALKKACFLSLSELLPRYLRPPRG
jgi:hypothetical protein